MGPGQTSGAWYFHGPDLIKYLLQLEYYGGHAQRKGAFFKFFEYRVCTDIDSTGHKNAQKIVSVTAWSNYIPVFLTVM